MSKFPPWPPALAAYCLDLGAIVIWRQNKAEGQQPPQACEICQGNGALGTQPPAQHNSSNSIWRGSVCTAQACCVSFGLLQSSFQTGFSTHIKTNCSSHNRRSNRPHHHHRPRHTQHTRALLVLVAHQAAGGQCVACLQPTWHALLNERHQERWPRIAAGKPKGEATSVCIMAVLLSSSAHYTVHITL